MELWQIFTIAIGMMVGIVLVVERHLLLMIVVIAAAVVTLPLPGFNFVSYSHLLVGMIVLGWVFGKLRAHSAAGESRELGRFEQPLFTPTLLYISAALMTVAAILSTLWNRDALADNHFSLSQFPFLLFLYISPIFLALAISETARTRSQVQRIIQLSVVPLILVVGLQLYFFLTRSGFPQTLGDKTTNAISFISIGNLSLFMMVYALVFLGLVLSPRAGISRRLAGAVLVIALLSLSLSLGRTEWIGLFAGVLAILLVSRRAKLGFLTLGWQSALLVAVILIAVSLEQPREWRTTSGWVITSNSLTTRADIWNLQIQAWKDTPLFGVGMGQGTRYASIDLPVSSVSGIIKRGFWPFGQQSVENPRSVVPVSGHSEYLKTLLDLGVLGFVSLIIAGCASLRYSWLLYSRSKETLARYLALGVIGATVGLMVAALAGPGILHTAVGAFPATIYFWVFLGLVLTLLRIEHLKPQTGDYSPRFETPDLVRS